MASRQLALRSVQKSIWSTCLLFLRRHPIVFGSTWLMAKISFPNQSPTLRDSNYAPALHMLLGGSLASNCWCVKQKMQHILSGCVKWFYFSELSISKELNLALSITNLAFCQAMFWRPRNRRGPASHLGPCRNKEKKGSETLQLLVPFVGMHKHAAWLLHHSSCIMLIIFFHWIWEFSLASRMLKFNGRFLPSQC